MQKNYVGSIGLVFLLAASAVTPLDAQTPALESHFGLTDAGYNNLTSTVTQAAPQDATNLPPVGMFYSLQNPSLMPTPGNFYGLPAWDLGQRNYLLDDVDFQPQARSGRAKNELPWPPGGGTNGNGSTNGFVYTFDTNGLWLELTNLSNGIAYGNLHNATNQVYALWSTTNGISGWQVETELWPSNNSIFPFSVETAGRSNLFMMAQDWTGVTHGGNTTPDWWFYLWLGGLDYSDTNLDSQGRTLLYDYQHGGDPNVISFNPVVANNYVNTSSPSVGLDVTAGLPYYMAVSVDDSNYAADANWQPYTGSNVIANLGSTQGWHNVWIGLRGPAPDATQTWQSKRLKLDLNPPPVIITSPATNIVSVPVIQLQGYSPEALAGMTYDLSNAATVVTGQQVLIVDQYYDANASEFTTNYFQIYDVALTNGLNTFTLYATDLAGNVTTTNFSVTLDYSGKTNPPSIQFIWPQDGMTASGTNIIVNGWVSDPTATVTAQMAGTNGTTNIFTASVGRDGQFYIQNVSLAAGTNVITFTATDAAGNVMTTNLTVVQGSIGLSVDPIATNQTTVTGEIGSSGYVVWVNGVEATNNNNGTWTATNVPIPPNSSLVQVTAIPATDNGGNGSGGGAGVNPTSSQSMNAVAAASNTGIFVSSFTGSYLHHITSTNGNLYKDAESLNWTNGGSGQYTDTVTFQTPSYDETIEIWPPNSWPQPEMPGARTTILGEGTNINQGPVLYLPWEHSTVNLMAQRESDVETATYSQNTEAKLSFATGGTPGSTNQRLWKVTVSATNTSFFATIWSIGFGAFDTVFLDPIPPEQLTAGVFGQVDSNGYAYAMLPDNTTVDATVYAPGYDYYSFSAVASAEQLPIEISVTSPSTAVPASTPNHDWVVLRESPGSFATLKANYPDSAVLDAIKWNVGQSTLGNMATGPSGRFVPISTSSLIQVTATAQLGFVTFRGQMNLWVMWCIVDPVITQNVTNPAPASLSFTNLSFANQPVWCTNNSLGVQYYPSGPNPGVPIELGQVCVICKLTPAGINKVLSPTTSDFVITQYRLEHSFVDGKTNYFDNNYQTNWINDNVSPGWMTDFPDSSDQMYLVDGPSISKWANYSDEVYTEFYDDVTWNNQNCTGTNSFWLFQGVWLSTGNPQLKASLDTSGTAYDLPTTSQYPPP